MAGSENEPINSSSSEEEGSESESDPNTLTTPSSNPINHDHSKQPRSTGKRPASDEEATDIKRIKNKIPAPAPEGEKKQLFQRLWSEDNEIELIQGMISYVNEKGKDPVADVNDFHEFVKQSLHVDVNDRQMLTKARRLKKKFRNNVAKAETNGKVRSLSNPHEKRMYELSKTLWGSDGGSKNVVTKKVNVNVTPKVNGSVGIEVSPNEVELEAGHGLDRVGLMGLPVTDEGIMEKGLELVSGAKRVEMEEKWKSLKVLELEHFLKKMDVLKEQAEVVLKAVADSGAK